MTDDTPAFTPVMSHLKKKTPPQKQAMVINTKNPIMLF